MPSNFTQTMPTPEVQNVASTYQPDTNYDATFINAATKSVTGFLEGLKKEKGDEALGSFSAELADIENQNISYQEQYARLQEAAAMADDRTRGQVQEELAKLRAGRVQGTLSASNARIRTNALIKDYMINYPHLAKDIRTMANSAMDNMTEIHNEIFGQDPVTKAANSVHTRAMELGVSPDEIIARDNARATADTLKMSNELRGMTQSQNIDTAVTTYGAAAYGEAMLAFNNVIDNVKQSLISGSTFTENDVTVQLEQARTNILRDYTARMVGMPGFKNERMQDIMGPVDALYASVDKMLKSTDTLDNKLKNIQNRIALSKAEKESAPVDGFLSMFPEAMRPGIVASALMISTSSVKDPEAWKAVAGDAVRQGNPAVQLGINYLQTVEGQRLVGTMVGSMVQGQEATSGNPVIDTMSKREAAKFIGRLLDPQQRQEYTGGVLRSFDWVDIKRNPEVASEVSKNPAFTTMAMQKAAAYQAQLADAALGGDFGRVKLTHTNPEKPFTVAGAGVGFVNRQPFPGEGGPATQLEQQLNGEYWYILNTFGVDALNTWIENLGLDNPKSPSGSGEPPAKKKVSPPGEHPALTKAIDINSTEGFDLPDNLIRAFAAQETSGGENIQRSSAGAEGLLQIIPSTFKAIDQKYFKGSLDWNKPEDQTRASLALLRDLWDRHGGDVTKVAMEYYSGTTNPSRRPKDGKGPSAGQYAQSIMRRYNSG